MSQPPLPPIPPGGFPPPPAAGTPSTPPATPNRQPTEPPVRTDDSTPPPTHPEPSTPERPYAGLVDPDIPINDDDGDEEESSLFNRVRVPLLALCTLLFLACGGWLVYWFFFAQPDTNADIVLSDHDRATLEERVKGFVTMSGSFGVNDDPKRLHGDSVGDYFTVITSSIEGERPAMTTPSPDPSADPSQDPSADPSASPSADPSTDPSADPSQDPSASPSASPSPSRATNLDQYINRRQDNYKAVRDQYIADDSPLFYPDDEVDGWAKDTVTEEGALTTYKVLDPIKVQMPATAQPLHVYLGQNAPDTTEGPQVKVAKVTVTVNATKTIRTPPGDDEGWDGRYDVTQWPISNETFTLAMVKTGDDPWEVYDYHDLKYPFMFSTWRTPGSSAFDTLPISPVQLAPLIPTTPIKLEDVLIDNEAIKAEVERQQAQLREAQADRANYTPDPNAPELPSNAEAPLPPPMDPEAAENAALANLPEDSTASPSDTPVETPPAYAS